MAFGHTTRQIEYDKSPAEAWNEFRIALEKIGNLKEADESTLRLRGNTKYGLQTVMVKVVFEHAPQGSRITLHAFSDDIWASGAKDALTRLLETFEYRENPDYVPQKQGTVRYSLLFLCVIIVAAVAIRMFRLFPQDAQFWIIVPLGAFGVLALIYVLVAQWRFKRG